MRVFIFGKKEKKISLLIVFLLVAVLFSLPWVNASSKMLPIYRVNTNEQKIAITFDVAWGDEDLSNILNILDKNEVKATFFVTGEFARRLPDDVKKMKERGHAIENHSNNHPHIKNMSKESIEEDAKKCDDELKKLTGNKTTYYRAPYGEYNNTVIEALKDYQVIQWDVDSVDWKVDTTCDKIIKNVEQKTRAGSILLFHIGSKAKLTDKSLETIIPDLKEKFEIVPLSELVPKDNYIINIKGELIKSN